MIDDDEKILPDDWIGKAQGTVNKIKKAVPEGMKIDIDLDGSGNEKSVIVIDVVKKQ